MDGRASSNAGSRATSSCALGHVSSSPTVSTPTIAEVLLSPVAFSSLCRRISRHDAMASQVACPVYEMVAVSSSLTIPSSPVSKSDVGRRLEKSLMATTAEVVFESPSMAAIAVHVDGPDGCSRSSGLFSPCVSATYVFGRRVGSMAPINFVTNVCLVAFGGNVFCLCMAFRGLSVATFVMDDLVMGRTNGRLAMQSPKIGMVMNVDA